MAARKVLAGFAVLALGVVVLASVAAAAPPCGHKACSDEVAASGLSGQARRACFKQVIVDCNAGACSCTGGSPPCSCVTCSGEGTACGTCGNGVCVTHCGAGGLVCLDNNVTTCFAGPCITDAQCPAGTFCGANGAARCGSGELNACCPLCPSGTTTTTTTPSTCALQPGPPGPICGGGCPSGTDQFLFDPMTMMCRCLPPTAACEQQPQAQGAVGRCPSAAGECQEIGTAGGCPIP